MKLVQLRAFEKHLKEADPKHLASVYTILSKEDFPLKAALDLLLKALLKDLKSPEMGVTTFNAQEESLEAIVGELNTFSFFSEHRVLVVHQADKLVKAEHAKLDAFFAKPFPRTTLVFTASTLASNTNFYKKVEKAGIIVEIPEEKVWEKEKSLQSWVIAYAAQAGKKIDPQTALFLIKTAGTDQSTLKQELDKLLCYLGVRGEMTSQDVSKLCSTANLETIWQLGEALFRRDASAALRIGKGMLEEGTPLLSLLRQLRSQYQTDFQVSCILASGGTASDVSHQFPYMKGMILDRHLQSAQGYGKRKFKDGLLAIDAAELSAKNSAADEGLLAELLILKLTSP